MSNITTFLWFNDYLYSYWVNNQNVYVVRKSHCSLSRIYQLNANAIACCDHALMLHYFSFLGLDKYLCFGWRRKVTLEEEMFYIICCITLVLCICVSFFNSKTLVKKLISMSLASQAVASLLLRTKSKILIQILGNRLDLLTRKIIDSSNCHLSNAFEFKTNDYSNLIAAFYQIFPPNLWENNILLKVDLFLSDQSFEVLKRQKDLLCEKFTFSCNKCKF